MSQILMTETTEKQSFAYTYNSSVESLYTYSDSQTSAFTFNLGFSTQQGGSGNGSSGTGSGGSNNPKLGVGFSVGQSNSTTASNTSTASQSVSVNYQVSTEVDYKTALTYTGALIDNNPSTTTKATPANSAPSQTVLPVAATEYFAPNDQIIINPQNTLNPTTEIAVISSIQEGTSFTFASPLKNVHGPGEIVEAAWKAMKVTPYRDLLFGGIAFQDPNAIQPGTVKAVVSDKSGKEGKEVKEKEVSDIKTTDIKTADIKTTDIKTKDIKTTDIKATDIKTTDGKLADKTKAETMNPAMITGTVTPMSTQKNLLESGPSSALAQAQDQSGSLRAFIRPEERPPVGPQPSPKPAEEAPWKADSAPR
jgi:hypothetical protein